MDLSIRPGRTLINENLSWIGKTEALKDADTITLDRSQFDLVTKFPNGFIPSGVALGKITATGIYGPYDDALTNGQEVCVGFLVASIVADRDSAATADLGAALLWRGEVVVANLPTNNGLDAAGKADLAAKFRFV